MKVLIIGSGRMGRRHAAGLLNCPLVSQIELADIHSEPLETARNEFKENPAFSKISFNQSMKFSLGADVVIFASTANNRFESCSETVKQVKPKYVLIEKPLGQSKTEVKKLIEYTQDIKETSFFVNLNMRLYELFRQLKTDLNTLSQFKGEWNFTLNTGTIGIGANGIHYLDLLNFLFDPDNIELAAAEIEDTIIPSGRGPQFADFGGWCTLKFYRKEHYLGRAQLSFSASSTVFGGWDIVGSHGRIIINEIPGKRTNILRQSDSKMPANRYAADYEPPVEKDFSSPFLGDLTRIWIEGLAENKLLLPEIKESWRVHELLFNWLEKSNQYKEVFPIT